MLLLLFVTSVTIPTIIQQFLTVNQVLTSYPAEGIIKRLAVITLSRKIFMVIRPSILELN